MTSATAGDALINAIAEAVADRLTSLVDEQRRVLTLEAAAEYLGMTPDALQHRAGVDVPCLAGERAKRRLRFDRRDLDRWIDRQGRDGV
jgi:Helix-turn-helix domain